MRAYKLMRMRKDGSLGSLFINTKVRIPVGEWLFAECHPTKGYAFRPGWHCTFKPVAPHLSTKGRVWCLVDISDFEEYERPERQGGKWLLAQRMKVIRVEPSKSKRSGRRYERPAQVEAPVGANIKPNGAEDVLGLHPHSSWELP